MPDDPATDLRHTLTRALETALAARSAVERGPVGAQASYSELRERLGYSLTRDGVDPLQVIDELAQGVRGGLHSTTGGRFFGWVIGGSSPAAVAADWLTSAWDQNAAMFTVAPAASVVEEIAGEWLKDVLRLPREASFAFVTGCQMAHVTCLAAARHALLERAGWNVETRGLNGAPPIRVLASGEVHATVPRALRLLGMGTDCVQTIETGTDARMVPEALERALQAEPDTLTIVSLQAGDLNTGSFDRFAELIPMARKHGAWVHIDGAFGLWTVASEKHASLTAGADMADSWATDGHKWLNVPYDCGYAFVRDRAAHRASFQFAASYISDVAGARDPLDWNPEWSRRARGFATYAAMRALGRDGIARQIDTSIAAARALTLGLAGLEGAELLWTPVINQGLVRFLHPGSAAEDDHARFTNAVTAAINASGVAFFGNVTWNGRRAMRISVSSAQTTADDVTAVVAGVSRVLAAQRACGAAGPV